MKKLIACLSTVLFLFVCVLPRGLVVSAVNIPVNARTFPDPNFRAWINAKRGWVSNGYLTDEAIKVQRIDVHAKDISSLIGIEHFTSLRELCCWENKLTTLDVSKNTSLVYLDCNKNELTNLDVSKNTALVTLHCRYNQLTKLDFSNPALTNIGCSNNQLVTLDVSKNTSLAYLDCRHNQLTMLDVSNTLLTCLHCSNNQLTALDISKISSNARLVNFSGENQNITIKMARIRGGWESLSPFLKSQISDPQNLANGITYTDGKIRSTSDNITETPFNVSINRRIKLSGKIIFEYVRDVVPSTLPKRDEEMPSSDYENVLQSFYSLSDQGCDIDDIMFQYDRLMLDVRGEEDYSEEDLQEQRNAREDYLNILRDIERDRELIRYKKLK
jgi:hypothetical protein